MDIIELIKSRGLTVAGVAKEAMVSRPTIYELARADSNPRIQTLLSVARAIGVTPATIRPDLSQVDFSGIA